MPETYKICYSNKTGRGAGNERYTWREYRDEQRIRQELEVAYGPITIYWISRDPTQVSEG